MAARGMAKLFVTRHSSHVTPLRGTNLMDTPTTSLTRYKMFVGGEWTDAASGATFETSNPYTGKPWALIPRAGAEDVDRAVKAAHKAFTSGDWPKLNATQRGALLRKLGDLIGPKARSLAEIE